MKPRVVGRAFIPHNRNTIVVANHASHLDMGLVRHALGTYGEDIVSLAAQDYFFEGAAQAGVLREPDEPRRARPTGGPARGASAGERGHRERQDGAHLPGGDAEHDGRDRRVQAADRATSRSRTASTSSRSTSAARTRRCRRGPRSRRSATSSRASARRSRRGSAAADRGDDVRRRGARSGAGSRAPRCCALRDGQGARPRASPGAEKPAEEEHPLVTLFAELEAKFNPGRSSAPSATTSRSETTSSRSGRCGSTASAARFAPASPTAGRPTACSRRARRSSPRSCASRTCPGPSDFLSGAIKSNDVSLLLTFQKVFQLES